MMKRSSLLILTMPILCLLLSEHSHGEKIRDQSTQSTIVSSKDQTRLDVKFDGVDLQVLIYKEAIYSIGEISNSPDDANSTMFTPEKAILDYFSSLKQVDLPGISSNYINPDILHAELDVLAKSFTDSGQKFTRKDALAMLADMIFAGSNERLIRFNRRIDREDYVIISANILMSEKELEEFMSFSAGRKVDIAVDDNGKIETIDWEKYEIYGDVTNVVLETAFVLRPTLSGSWLIDGETEISEVERRALGMKLSEASTKVE